MGHLSCCPSAWKKFHLTSNEPVKLKKLSYSQLIYQHKCCVLTLSPHSIIINIQSFLFSQQITAAVKIQSAFRGFIQRRRYHQQRDAAITLQRYFRVLRLARVKEENLRRRHNAAIYIQALWRGWLARQQASLTNVITFRHFCNRGVFL